MLLCNWAIIWMPLLIFPYVLSLVSQMQLDTHVNPIPTTNCQSVWPSACWPACLPGFPLPSWRQWHTYSTANLMNLTGNTTHKQEVTYEHKNETSVGTECTGAQICCRRGRVFLLQELQRELTSCCEAHHGDLNGQTACFPSPHLSILIYISFVFFNFLNLFICLLRRSINTVCQLSSTDVSFSLHLHFFYSTRNT